LQTKQDKENAISLESLMFKKQLLPGHQVLRKPEASLLCLQNSLSKYFVTERHNTAITYADTHVIFLRPPAI